MVSIHGLLGYGPNEIPLFQVASLINRYLIYTNNTRLHLITSLFALVVFRQEASGSARTAHANLTGRARNSTFCSTFICKTLNKVSLQEAQDDHKHEGVDDGRGYARLAAKEDTLGTGRERQYNARGQDKKERSQIKPVHSTSSGYFNKIEQAPFSLILAKSAYVKWKWKITQKFHNSAMK